MGFFLKVFMSWIAITLVLISACLHAAWNLLGKKVSPTVAFFSLAFMAGTLPLIPIIIPLLWLEWPAVVELLPVLAISGICQAVYCGALAKSYASGDMSVAYPLARAIPVMLVALMSSWVGMQSLLSWEAYLGVAMVILGAFLLPMRHFKDFCFSHYLNKSALLAIVAAMATAGYSIADKQAIDQLSRNIDYSPLLIATFYIWLESIAAGLFLLFAQLGRASDRADLRFVLTQQRRSVFITGFMITLTYLLILWAMQFTENVSYVVALRQVSIPIGALLGVFIFKESLGLPKALALGMLSTGVVLILV